MLKTWTPGATVALRGIYNNHIWIAQSAIVVKDDDQEVALAILPGAECAMPDGYIHGKHGPGGSWDRWGDYLNIKPKLKSFTWHTDRLLWLIEPEKYYATAYFWEAIGNQFLCYYINFQTPFQRSECGFDILDLELDIIIEPTYEWRWKDEEDYKRGIECGIIQEEWKREIDVAKQEVLEKLEKRQYPLNGSWLDWLPDPDWSPPKLPQNWDKI